MDQEKHLDTNQHLQMVPNQATASSARITKIQIEEPHFRQNKQKIEEPQQRSPHGKISWIDQGKQEEILVFTVVEEDPRMKSSFRWSRIRGKGWRRGGRAGGRGGHDDAGKIAEWYLRK